MLDIDVLDDWLSTHAYHPLFVTISGSHLYGFSSPDSDIDLRGAHLLPLHKVVGLTPPELTLERDAILENIEVEMVSHDLAKYLGLLVKNNGYVLEQIFSPLVVRGQEFLDRLRPIARRCITRHHYHHYRGFLGTQRKLLDKQEEKMVKSVLYAYRVVLTGIHLLRTGEVESNLPRLAEIYSLDFAPELIARKEQEKVTDPTLDWPFHDAKLTELEAQLDRAFADSTLPEHRNRESVDAFLIEHRLAGWTESAN